MEERKKKKQREVAAAKMNTPEYQVRLCRPEDERRAHTWRHRPAQYKRVLEYLSRYGIR